MPAYKRLLLVLPVAALLLGSCAETSSSPSSPTTSAAVSETPSPELTPVDPADIPKGLFDEKPLDGKYQGLFLKVEDFDNYLDSPAGWRTDAEEELGEEPLEFVEQSCDFPVGQTPWRGREQHAWNASQFGPVMVQQIRHTGKKEADVLIEQIRPHIESCQAKGKVDSSMYEGTSYTYELVDSTSVPGSVMWKRTSHFENPEDGYDTNVTYVGMMSKKDCLILFLWGMTPITQEFATPEILLDAMKTVSEK